MWYRNKIVKRYFYILQSLLISYSSKVTTQVGNFNSNFVQSAQITCTPYQTNSLSSSVLAAFENCEESARLGLLSKHPDQDKKTPEILETYGYPYETHNVTTEDNYILTAYRIIGSPNISPGRWAKNKYPVYLAHGALMASDGWNFQPGNQNLPFKLADAGFEVWLLNSRGTSYSMEHVNYNAEKDLEYWDFSFHELGIYDVPAVTSKILLESRAKKILYIGHSMGALQLLVCLSEIPEMNDKVEAAFLLAGNAFYGHSTHLMRRLSPFLSSYSSLQALNPLLRGRFGLPHKILERFNISLGRFCTPTALRCGLCQTTIFHTSGYNAPQINTTEIPNIIAKSGNTASAKTFSHSMQLMGSCKFQQYDYGYRTNMDIYGSPQPPEYKMENIRSSMYFYYGELDRSATPPDVTMTASRLAPGVLKELHKVEDELWNHNDFIYAKDADKLVYNRIVDEMERLSQM